MVVEDSEDEDLGGNGINSSSSDKKKFSSKATLATRNMINSSELLPKSMTSLAVDLERLVLYSATKQTWARHASAWNLYREFCDCFGISFNFPIPASYVRGFATWAVTNRKLKNSTVMAYISSLNIAHSLGSVSNGNLNSDPIVKMALAGNIYNISAGAGKTRLPMNIYLLEILIDRVAKSEWTDLSKQVFWTACMLCFFSTCRMGELLAQNVKSFDPGTTLLWENVKFPEQEGVLIFIPYSKTTGFKGKFIDLFPIKENKYCPVAAIKRLEKLAKKEKHFSSRKPGFSFRSGKFLTTRKVNHILSNLLGDFTDENHQITRHSFRAAIPSMLASFPGESNVEDIKMWGQWESSSFNLYTKQEREKRRAVFYKIVNCLYKL